MSYDKRVKLTNGYGDRIRQVSPVELEENDRVLSACGDDSGRQLVGGSIW